MSKSLTVKQVAEIFLRSDKTIRRWIKEGMFNEVRRVKDGYLIPVSEVERVLEESKIESPVKKRVPT